MKVSRKYYSLIFAVFVSLLMSTFMSAALTLVNTGFDGQFWTRWLLRAFPVSFLVSLPVSIVIIPPLRRIMDKIVA